MADRGDLGEALGAIADRVRDDMSERDVENLFLENGFYEALGYEGTGSDIRSEFTLPDDRRPDYLTLDANERVTAVYEFKTSGRALGPHRDQLRGYMVDLKADYGILTNGERLELHERGTSRSILELDTDSVTESNLRDLQSALEKPIWDITDPSSVDQYLEQLDPVSLDGELGQEHFFDTFRLEEGSPFADLVTAMMDLLAELRDEREAKFVKGAYDFWEASYANVPDDRPDSWEPFVDDTASLRDFMFSLESGHALLGRLLLAKATEDHDFFPTDRGLERYFDELGGFSGNIDLDAYPIAASGMIDDMRAELVESLFEDDIFVWWVDGYGKSRASQHASEFSRFRDVAKEGSSDTGVSPATRERFSRAIAHVAFAVLKFDFSRIEGDPLGDLYQRYFDPETRKALGEFYTPQPVVDYILDGVGYDVGVSGERLIDPACGSGTFLVEAVQRYLDDVRQYDDDPDWAAELRELCSRPRIVGLDIHPFAVLMAQIRFMVAILPEYKQAKQADDSFTIHRLPIFRTDSLRNERELTGLDLGDDGGSQLTFDAVTEDNQDVRIPVPLPVEVEPDEVDESEREGEFLVQRVRMPLFDTIRLETGVRNFGEYFAALQGVLDVVKWYMSEDTWEYSGGLEAGIHRYTTREYDGIEAFFAPYVDDVLDTVRYLQDEHGDGRLFKMFEDTVLALVVKNYMQYDYVVGNPPYVRVQYLPALQKHYFSELYQSAVGNYDLYCLFTERGLDLLAEGGRVGYIAPNQFMNTEYGRGMRREMLDRSNILEMYDFRNSGVFEDAMNCPAIFVLEREDDDKARTRNNIRCIRVKANVDESSGRVVDQKIIDAVHTHKNDPGYSDRFIDVFDFPQSNLDYGFWALMPKEEQEIYDSLEIRAGSTIEDVTDAVFQGIRTSSNRVYIVEVIDADRVLASDTGDVVTVVPIGGVDEFQIEKDLLRPFLQGEEIQRWRGDWSGRHVVHPYYVNETNGDTEADLYSENYLREELPLSWQFFEAHRETLEGREGGRMKGRDDWYGYIYPKNLDKFEAPKIIQPSISKGQSSFMMDEMGTWYFTTGYGTELSPEYRNRTEAIACLLNSSAIEFYFKHIAALKISGAYEYRSQFVEKLPCFVEWDDDVVESLRDSVRAITHSIDLQSRTDRFPEAYIGTFDGTTDYIDYEWQTARRPVDADIQELADGRVAVTAGNTDEITDPLIDRGDRDERKLRASYVHAAVDGRNAKKGEEMSIPIPTSEEGVRELLDELEADRRTVAETDVEALEAEIDDIVYDLFELTEEERAVVEEYLDVF